MKQYLSFKQLRTANILRLPEFRNGKGDRTHPNGVSDWALSQWSNAACGEAGEAANVVKKIERGDFTLGVARQALADELADAVTYLDLLALRAGIDLGDAVRHKFNEVSRRVDCNVFLHQFENSDDETDS